MTIPSGRRFAIVCAAYACLHLIFGVAARLFEVAPGVSLWYPPAGFTLAFVILCGVRTAPVVLVVNLLSAFVMSSAPASWTQLALALIITGYYTAAGAAVHRWFGPWPTPARPVRTSAFVALMMAAPIFAAITGTAVVFASGYASGTETFASMAFNWCVGDLMGVLTILPPCLVHLAPRLLGRQPSTRRKTLQEWIEIAAQAAAIVVCLLLVRGFGFLRAQQSFYLCFVPLVWICLRHGMRGASLAILVLTMGSLGSFRVAGVPSALMSDLLLFEIAVAAIGLGLGATVSRRAVAENERTRLLAILEATPDYIATADMSGNVLYQNAALLRLAGYATPAEARGKPMADHHPDWASLKLVGEGIPAALATGMWEGETALRDAQGREVPVAQRVIVHCDDEGNPVMLSSVARDISADKAAERARLDSERNLLQAQKLESLGVLAGGIAHDFNNLLTVMLGNATLARLDVAADSPAEQAIHQIELAALRAAELCRQMLAYAGKGQLAMGLVDLTTVVEQTTHLLKVSISKKCRLEFDLARNLPAVNADATQLSQITMNLVMNASDACGDAGGEVTVRTGVMYADRAYLAATYLSPELEAGSYVFLEVADSGCGMSPQVLSRIFEPFFTTKFSGHGLGLSAVLGIARSHRGAIKVDSSPAQGTTFRLLLPATKAPLALPRTESAPMSSWRGSGRILVVDDEEPVREIAARILERFGFESVPAANGREAVDRFRENPSGFRAVLLDLTMPVMNGAEAFRELRRLDPTVPVILMSGYNKTDSAARFASDGLSGFVQKPFDAGRLGEVLRAALEDQPAPTSTLRA